METNITKQDIANFELICTDNSVFLLSCFVDGKEAVAICKLVPNSYIPEYVDKAIVEPMFVSITETMYVTDHNGKELTTLVYKT